MRIERVEKLARCPAAVRLGIEALHYLHQNGWTEGSTTGLGYDHRASVAYDKDGAAVGLIIYQEQEWKNSLSIEVGYVVPSHHRTGIYRALWDDLCAYAQEKGFAKITGATHWENRRMQRVMEKLGREATWLVYEYRVPEKETTCDS